MVGKMSTTIRVIEMNPMRTMSMAAIAIVYGRRNAILTRLIMLKPSFAFPRRKIDVSLLHRQGAAAFADSGIGTQETQYQSKIRDFDYTLRAHTWDRMSRIAVQCKEFPLSDVSDGDVQCKQSPYSALAPD